MKIAIHHVPNTNSESKSCFNKNWISYCEENKIDYALVNCFKNNIIEELKNFDVLLWHHNHAEIKDTLSAKNILFALEQSGKKVFPDFNTNWHFDDKIAQKYLLESINAPLVPSYVFYDKNEALKWIDEVSFPKVFKLKGGAGSTNVFLVNNKSHAKKLVKKAFSSGFHPQNRKSTLADRLNGFKWTKKTFVPILKSIYRYIQPNEFYKLSNKEKGYIYFQEFIPNNNFDIRIIVIGDKAFGIKRLVRKNDFRASGSGSIIYDTKEIDVNCVKLSFDINKNIKAQSLTIDYVFDQNKNPLIVEISYGFDPKGYYKVEGYWDSKLDWYNQKIEPYKWMIDNLLK
jgi:glutathione synthase/RimK-type ligase-like ATP-grasp enzyme